MRQIFVLACLLFAAPVYAQRPEVATTLQTTDTSTTSLKVGCAVGSSTCTGGVSAGPYQGSSMSITGGYLELQSNVPAATTYRLYNNAGTLTWNGAALAVGSSVSGTLNKIPVFTASNAIGDSIMSQSGTTITVATTLNATTLGGTLSTASQPNVTGLGTIATGTWNATKIGLAYGGTNADLSGTGGTSQFLRQNTLGGAVTVVRPAVADLSDASNVALLNAANTFTAAGTHAWSGSNASAVFGAGAVTSDWVATSALQLQAAAGGSYATMSIASQRTDGAGTRVASLAFETLTNTATYRTIALIEATTAGATANKRGGTLGFYTQSNNTVGPSLRWGINENGDWTRGSSSNISESVGVPTCGSGCSAISGTDPVDYAFGYLGSATGHSSATINFGHTWTNAPYCTANASVAMAIGVSTTTTAVTLSLTTGTSSELVSVVCKK